MNNALHAIGGVAATDYMAGSVAWNDNRRGVAYGGALTPLGNNITDARILSRSGRHFPFVRPHNLDEKLAITTADNILFAERDGRQVTAQQVLETLAERSAYMGFTSVEPNVSTRQKVIYRVQNAWVPFETGTTSQDVVPAHYSYQTTSDADPRNLIVVGTAQGVFVHSDGVGVRPLFAHGTGDDGSVTEHWFTAEAMANTRVGEAVSPNVDGSVPTRAHGANAVEMGVRGMGARANCFVVMSIPNRQASTHSSFAYDGDTEPVYRSLSLSGFSDAEPVYRSIGACDPTFGVSHAARVSVAETVAGTVKKTTSIAIHRPIDEPIVCTILLYNTMSGSSNDVPCEVHPSDLARAVDDMERIYALATKHGGCVCKLSTLSDMLHTLMPTDVAVYATKTSTDPPMLPCV